MSARTQSDRSMQALVPVTRQSNLTVRGLMRVLLDRMQP
jgi:hypothetical protein